MFKRYLKFMVVFLPLTGCTLASDILAAQTEPLTTEEHTKFNNQQEKQLDHSIAYSLEIQTDPRARSQIETAQKVEVFPLYKDKIPGSKYSSKTEKNTGNTPDNRFIIDIATPTITGYFPEQSNLNSSKPNSNKVTSSAVIICPGGSYKGLAIDKEGHDVARRLNSLGITAFVLKYRTPSDDTMVDKKTGPLQDIQQAINFVRQHSEKWHINPNKIGVMGFSAGGHLAASAAVHFNDPVLPNHTPEMVKPNFQVLIYPVISMQNTITHQGSQTNLLGKNTTPELLAYYSNETQVSNQTPIGFIVHANNDSAVPVENSLNYYQALRSKDVDTQLLILPKGGHGFGMRHPFDWFTSLTMWLDNNQL